ncbi:MAG: putative DNA-binding domain-containing protein [Pseudomonadota bacterium]
MAETPDFQQKQYAFAAHLRDPANVPAPDGIEDRRLKIYRHLFFSNLRTLLGNMFPVLRKLYDDDQWSRIIRQFMRNHQASTPYFLQIPGEFLAFLQDSYAPLENDFPFLVELAHYEHAELALSISELENDVSDVDEDGDLLANAPVKSELAWPYAYSFPVHRISTDFKPEAPGEQPTFLVIYRNTHDKVRFLELNPMTAALLDAIENNQDNKSGETMLRELASASGYPDADALVEHGHAALKEMRQREILTGTRVPA